MRISIWQQWASNHSAAFTVMGRFRTVEDAQRVGGILKDILRQVARWKQQDSETKWQAYLAARQIQQPTPSDRDQFEDKYYADEEPTEIEQRLAEQYDVSWVHTLQYAQDPEVVPNAVLVADRVVIVAEDLIDFYTWTGFWPFEQLMRKLGGEVAIGFEYGGSIRVIIRCMAPDESTAIRLLQEVRHQVDTYGVRSFDMISIEGLDFEGKPMTDSVPGSVTCEGLTVTYTYEEWHHGRIFVSLLKYLRSQGCTIIDYTLETLEVE